ncbi:MAG TPA: hypothetical protein VIY09_03565 [Rhizomicrobium sp.]|jgi:hypothetical protein
MSRLKRAIRRKNITDLARQTWSRIWSGTMPPGWKVYLVRKTVVQRTHGRRVCGLIDWNRKTILVARNTDHYSFQTLVHELTHLRTIDEEVDHGPRWQHEFHKVARSIIGEELETDICLAPPQSQANLPPPPGSNPRRVSP